MKKLIIAIVAFFAVLTGSAQQTIELTNWKFQPGDNLEWLKPRFDDSAWKPIKAGESWESQGYGRYDGYAWYRVKFTLPANIQKRNTPNAINFLLGRIDDCDQVFLNGRLLGQNGVTCEDIARNATTATTTDLSKSGSAGNRNYILEQNDPRMLWGKENTLAVRVYDAGGNGGILSPAYVIAAYPGAMEKTPARSEYFSWINHTNEGPDEAQTLANLDLFRWLRDEYGMQLDIYAFDAGAIDGAGFYGSMNSKRFKGQFPRGFSPISEKAKSMGTILGLWGGPDGFGNTPEEEKQRADMMVGLVRDHHFGLFKMDAVCGPLRPEKYDAFDNMMTECRKYNPNLILLNHRLDLGKGVVHSTTYLMDGSETYVDVNMTSYITSTHNRTGNLSRGLTPNLTRLTEDHGVCLSSCLDYWEDDLVLQAFNRSLVISPELYGSPCLLSDNEFPRLARIFNLARQYRDILPEGMVLPEAQYGPNAVSRGDGSTRLLTLRNLTWNPLKYTVSLNASVGLIKPGKVQVKQYHPTEKVLGYYTYGSKVEVEVLPFRSCLVKLTTAKDNERSVEGCNYEVVREVEGKPMEIKLLGMPGEKCSIKLSGDFSKYDAAILGNESQPGLLKGKTIDVQFSGTPLKENFHRKLGDLTECAVPENARNLYEATCFAGSNSAHEEQSLRRSGSTKIPQVQAARDAFFNHQVFIERNIFDSQLFDGNRNTGYAVCTRWWGSIQPGALRIDVGKAMQLDSLVIELPDGYSISPLRADENVSCKVSKDLKEWKAVNTLANKRMVIDLTKSGMVQYLALEQTPINIVEITGYRNGKPVDRSNWRANNLFADSGWGLWARKAWSQQFTINEAAEGSYLCIAINGQYDGERVFAAIEVDGQPVGCPTRSPSYKSNVVAGPSLSTGGNYTYYVPVTKDMVGKNIKAWVLSADEKVEVKPEVWMTAYPIPYKTMDLKIQ